jgi:L-aspartate oxidase
MKGLPADTDFVVIGAGIAGLRAAIELAAAGSVLVLAKKEIDSSQSAQVTALSDEDEVSLQLQATLSAGDGLCNPAAVKILLEEAPERIEELIVWGKPHATKLVFGLDSPHSRHRSLHAQGESTGREILRAMYVKAKSLKHISFAEFVFSTDLLSDAGRITGVSVLDEKGVPQEVSCSAVLLATGGMGQIYRNTTNPDTATGDGIAMAYRAGAELSDMELVQFHPTALYMKKVPRFMLSDALRAEGACLRNIELNRFMGKYHALGEQAPREVVARAIVHEMEVSRAKDPLVYLDLTHLSPSKVQKRFPRIYATCMQYNVDITEDVIPVRPAAHFSMGGVRTDVDGKTNVAGLYAAGETAATGVHGANRLASNSLLEGLVFGARAGKAMREKPKPMSLAKVKPKAAYSNGPVAAGLEEVIGQIQLALESEVGIVRTRMGMQKALKSLEEVVPKLAHPGTKRALEARSLLLAGLLVTRSALAREESRGAHYRMDYPDHDDKKFLKHSVTKGENIWFI